MSAYPLPVQGLRAEGRARVKLATGHVRAADPAAYDRAHEDTTRRLERARLAAREELRRGRLRSAGIAAGVILLAGLFGALLLLAGCTQPDAAYVEGDVRTYEAVAPDYVGLVERSGRAPEDIARAKRTVRSWRLRIVAAGATPTPTADPFGGSAAEAVSGTAR